MDENDLLSDESDIDTQNLPDSSTETGSYNMPGTLSVSQTCLPGPSLAVETNWTKKGNVRENIPDFSIIPGLVMKF